MLILVDRFYRGLFPKQNILLCVNRSLPKVAQAFVEWQQNTFGLQVQSCQIGGKNNWNRPPGNANTHRLMWRSVQCTGTTKRHQSSSCAIYSWSSLYPVNKIGNQRLECLSKFQNLSLQLLLRKPTHFLCDKFPVWNWYPSHTFKGSETVTCFEEDTRKLRTYRHWNQWPWPCGYRGSPLKCFLSNVKRPVQWAFRPPRTDKRINTRRVRHDVLPQHESFPPPHTWICLNTKCLHLFFHLATENYM